MTGLYDVSSNKGNPKLSRPAPVADLATVDRVYRFLGWVGVGLGVVELLAPRIVTSTLGVRGKESLIRAYGVHEMGTGALLIAGEKPVGLWSRLVGDGLNFALLIAALRRNNPKRGNARWALVALAGLTLFDLATTTRPAAPPDGTR